MTKVRLSKNGFSVKGHCTADAHDEEGRLVCASVSSAAYMAANTITDVVKDKADIRISDNDGEMILKVVSPSKETFIVLEGFKIHILQLSEQYPDCIKVISEV
jgi:uncharacterized protein YsxB (DUF464 family)